jgi:hypothetical protein
MLVKESSSFNVISAILGVTCEGSMLRIKPCIIGD